MRRNFSAPTSASVILASRNEGAMLRRTLESMEKAAGDLPFEVIVVDDGSTDGSVSPDFSFPFPLRILQTKGLGVAPARNAGARAATGEMLVFCDAHISVPPGWLDSLACSLEDSQCQGITPGIGSLEPDGFLALYQIAASAPRRAVGCGRTFRTLGENTWLPMHDSPRECPVLSGGCFALRRWVWEQVGGYEEAFRGYGYDEEEISLKLWLRGFRLMTAPEVTILHQFRPAAPYPILGRDRLGNQLYGGLCHFSNQRLGRLLALLSRYPDFGEIRREVFGAEDWIQKREAYQRARVHDDDWYFQKFSLDL